METPQKKTSEWHSFFSEKDGREFFFSPAQKYATWFSPGDDEKPDMDPATPRTPSIGDDDDDSKETNGKDDNKENKRHVPMGLNKALNFVEELKTPVASFGTKAVQKARETMEELKAPTKEFGTRAVQQAKETTELVEQSFQKDPKPWILVLLVFAGILLSLILSQEKGGFPIVTGGRVVVCRTATGNEGVLDILNRVQSTVKDVVGEQSVDEFAQKLGASSLTRSNRPQPNISIGEEILHRVGLSKTELETPEELSKVEDLIHRVQENSKEENVEMIRTAAVEAREKATGWVKDFFSGVRLDDLFAD